MRGRRSALAASRQQRQDQRAAAAASQELTAPPPGRAPPGWREGQSAPPTAPTPCRCPCLQSREGGRAWQQACWRRQAAAPASTHLTPPRARRKRLQRRPCIRRPHSPKATVATTTSHAPSDQLLCTCKLQAGAAAGREKQRHGALGRTAGTNRRVQARTQAGAAAGRSRLAPLLRVFAGVIRLCIQPRLAQLPRQPVAGGPQPGVHDAALAGPVCQERQQVLRRATSAAAAWWGGARQRHEPSAQAGGGAGAGSAAEGAAEGVLLMCGRRLTSTTASRPPSPISSLWQTAAQHTRAEALLSSRRSAQRCKPAPPARAAGSPASVHLKQLQLA